MSFEILDDDNEIIFDPHSKVVSAAKYNETLCRGLGYEFFSSMKENCDKIAQYNADTATSDTYGELLLKGIRVALNLRDRKIKKNDIVCLCSYNHRLNVLPVIASLFINVKFASIDPSLKVMDAVYLLKKIKPTICFIVPESLELVRQALESAELESEVVVYDEIDEDTKIHPKYGTSFSDFLIEHEEEDNFVPEEVDPCETCCIYFSSGTTGLPKGVCLGHKMLFFAGLAAEASCFVRNDQSVILAYSTFYWITGMLNLSLAMITGAARVISKSFDPIRFWEFIEKYKVTYAFLAPIQAYSITSVGKPENIDTTSLNLLATGGSRFASDSIHKLRDLLPGTFVDQVYGSTEAGAVFIFKLKSIKDRLHLHHKPDSCGRPIPGIQYKIVDPDSAMPCGTNENGELRVKSDFLFNGYYDADFSDEFDEHGFFKTGDVAYFDDDFCFYIVDRMKDLLKYRNWQVSPSYLEQVLKTHQSVVEVVVVGVPHETDGDHPMALVIPRENDDISETSLEEYVNEKVNDAHQLRGGVKFMESFPMTASGKVKRRELKQLILHKAIGIE